MLKGWLDRGGPVPSVLTIETAIELLDDEDRSVVSLMALAALAIQRGLDEELAGRQFVTLVDGSRHCPDDGLPIVQSAPGGLADRLGFAEVIAGEHLVEDPHAQTVGRWLRDKGYLMDHDNDEEVLVRLAREADRESEPRHLDDEQITELRSALEKLGKERWEQLSPRVSGTPSPWIALHMTREDDGSSRAKRPRMHTSRERWTASQTRSLWPRGRRRGWRGWQPSIKGCWRRAVAGAG